MIVAAVVGAGYYVLVASNAPRAATLDRVSISPGAAASLYPGDATTLTAAAYDTSNRTITSATFAWEVTSGVAILDRQDGATVTATASVEGAGLIRVTARLGNQQRQATVNFRTITLQVATLAVDPAEPPTFSGSTPFTFTASSLDQRNKALSGVAYSWQLSSAYLGTLDTTVGPRVRFTPASDTAASGGLDVTATRGTSTKTARVPIHVLPAGAPTADLRVSRHLMNVTVDASGSRAAAGTSITRYRFDFGDGTAQDQAEPRVSREYPNEGTYVVRVTVMANNSRNGVAQTMVTVAHSTIDYTYNNFFNIPYQDYWYRRNKIYGDIILRNSNTTECPCTDWYPWTDRTIQFIYSDYHMNVTGLKVPGYSIDQPVMLPTAAQLKYAYTPLGTLNVATGSLPPGGEAKLAWQWNYFTLDNYTKLAAGGYPVPTRLVDGFEGVYNGTIDMDYLASQKIFGVMGDPHTFWSTMVNNSYNTQGPLETAYDRWLMYEGLGPYEVFNAFEYFYSPLTNMQMTAQVIDNPDGSNTTHVYFWWTGWGQEVLLARWFYWGATPYELPGADNEYGNVPQHRCLSCTYDNQLNPAVPTGWWNQELGWFEHLRFNATLGSALTFDLSTDLAYQFKAWALPGPDGAPGGGDDIPIWDLEPARMDYVEASSLHPATELVPYYNEDGIPTSNYTHYTPGSSTYGTDSRYDYAPVTANLKDGQTMTYSFPKNQVVFYDPNLSLPPLDPTKAGTLVETMKYMKPTEVVGLPASAYAVAGNVIQIVGKTNIVPVTTVTYGGTHYPLEGTPNPVFLMGENAPAVPSLQAAITMLTTSPSGATVNPITEYVAREEE